MSNTLILPIETTRVKGANEGSKGRWFMIYNWGFIVCFTDNWCLMIDDRYQIYVIYDLWFVISGFMICDRTFDKMFYD
jgi:hypothetical protein